MSDSNQAIAMQPDVLATLWPETRDDCIGLTDRISGGGMHVVTTLAAGARVGDVVNTLVFLPGGRTQTLSSTVTQNDINARRISQRIPELALEEPTPELADKFSHWRMRNEQEKKRSSSGRAQVRPG